MDAVETTRDRLLSAGRELFTTIGYHGTTTPILAERAGVAEGTIYRHFKSKRALLNAAFQDAQRWGVQSVTAAGTGPAADRMTQLGREWLAVAEHDPARMRLLLAWRLASELDDPSRVAAAEFRQGVERLVALGKQEGSVRPGVVELWATVWLTLVTSAVERVAAKEWSASHPHAMAVVEAAWEAIAAHRPAPARVAGPVSAAPDPAGPPSSSPGGV
jgi:AcrR family transcriptional regulator